MKVEDYLDHLLKTGMGWLGWSEAQTLDTSMRAIVMAYDGRVEMLQSIFGGGSQKTGEADDPEAAPQAQLADNLKTAFRSLMKQPAAGLK